MAKIIKILPKNITFPKAIVLDKGYKELYEEADRKTAEKFGEDSLAYKTITNGIDIKNVTGSQFFWNANLNLYLPNNMKVTELSDWEDINDINKDFLKGFYKDSAQIVLRTKNPSWDKNKYILNDLVKQFRVFDFSPENPLLITDLELVKDDNPKNEYGLLLKIGSDTKRKNDKRFAYSNNGKRIPFGKGNKKSYAKENGLSGVYLCKKGNLYSKCDALANSNNVGRVVVKDAEKDFEVYTPKQISSALKRLKMPSLETQLLERLKQ